MMLPEPVDLYAQRLQNWTRPPDWRQPMPAQRYNLVVIGGGPAGLVCAAGAAGLGARVALVEKYRLGGDCLHFGCVPSKALLRCAHLVGDVRRAADLGVTGTTGVHVDFTKVMERLRRVRSEISEADSAQRFSKLGVDVFFGAARFIDRDCVTVGDLPLRFARAVIATGAGPSDPGIPGLQPGTYLTNETIFNLTQLPARLIVLGAGPVGCELAQAFAQCGSEVHLVNRSPRILSHEEPEAASTVLERLQQIGVRCHLGVDQIGAEDSGLSFCAHGRKCSLAGDALLVATGRTPNVADLCLDHAGVEVSGTKIVVDDYLRTTNVRIYAAGDVCGDRPYTHAADAMARLVLRNALFFGRQRWSQVVVPHCTYTDPELAAVGLTAAEADRRGICIQTFRVPFSDVDRAVLEGETTGFSLVHVRAGTDRIVGATIVGRHAGELISEIGLAMTRGIGLGNLAAVVRSYPTRAQVLSKLADAYQRTRLSPKRARLLAWFMRLRRRA